MAAPQLIDILERTVTGCKFLFVLWCISTVALYFLRLAQADLENARNFLARAAVENLVSEIH